jgi:hypothetical protein
MSPFALVPLFVVGLFLGMLLMLEIGRRLGLRRIARDPEAEQTGFAAIEGAVFGLLGLLIAFTFSGAAARFEARRQLIVEEANAIGTAYSRLDLLPSAAQPPLRDLFRQYADSRLEVYRLLPDAEAAMAELARSTTLQAEIWKQSVAACRAQNQSSTTMLLVPALNSMMDITTTRTMAARTHPPLVIFAMLAVLALVSSLLAGHGMAGSKRRSWLHLLGFAVILALTVYVIIDIEYPRRGLIRIDSFDQVLRDVRQSMNGDIPGRAP